MFYPLHITLKLANLPKTPKLLPKLSKYPNKVSISVTKRYTNNQRPT